MYLTKIDLQNFRNYSDTVLEFNKRGNLLFGKNGQGKTNLLESLYYLSVFRSFRKGVSRDLVSWGKDWFRVTGLFLSENSLERTLSVQWNNGKSKQVFYENDRVDRLSDVLGYFPSVILSPESVEISQGLPGARRKFLDLCFSIVDKEYLENLIAYKRVLKHRNSLLYSANNGKSSDYSILEPWDEKLIQHGAFLIERRVEAIKVFSEICREKYSAISGGSEELEIRYCSNAYSGGDTLEYFRTKIIEKRPEEARKKTTLVGPHRDDLLLELNGHDARKFGSQGQHKTILLALKAAELQYIAEKKHVKPVILLDDLFALLDKKRLMAFLNILKEYSQFFITANVEIKPDELLAQAGFVKEDFSQYYVEGGNVQRRS